MSSLQADILKNLVKVNLTHSILSMHIPEVRFSRFDSVWDVKMQLEKRFGTSAGAMTLVLKDLNNQPLATMTDEYKPLNFYGIEDDHTIHCIDEDPNSILRGLEDLSAVDKYVMSDADYDKLPMNVRKFKQHMAKNNPELFNKKALSHTVVTDPEHEKDLAAAVHKGDRCELNQSKHRGEVAYVGKVPDLGEGYFVGIKLDEPYGNNDGSVSGVKYFSCLPKYGVYLRPSEISVGDFPELDIDEI